MASIDPSIPLSVRPVQLRDPLETAAAAAAYQNALQGNALNVLRMHEMQRASMEDADTKDAMREFYRSDGGKNALLTLAQRSPKAFQGERKRMLDEEKDRAEIGSKTATTDKTAFDTKIAKIGAMSQAFNEVRDQPSYTVARQVVGKLFGPESMAQIPEQYNPQEVMTLRNASLRTVDYLTNQRALATQAETGRHNRATERITERGQDMAATTARETKADDRNFARSDKLRDEYNKLSGDFIKVRDAYNRILSSKESAAGDLSLIFNYMKMLDPGSVVRESEFATAQNAAGVPDIVRNMYNRAMSGERMNPAQRAQFKEQADSLYQSASETQGSLERNYTGMAQRFNVSPEDVLQNFRLDDSKRARPPGQPQTAPGLPPGWSMRRVD